MKQKIVRKNLFIVRHGHAIFEGAKDFDRPLNNKGILSTQLTATYISNHIKEQNINPELCITSAALRARQTAEIICKAIDIDCIDYDIDLYTSSVSQWLDKLTEVSATNILLVGHNPTFSQMLQHWCGYEYYMKPANCAVITLEIKEDGIIYPARLHDFYQHE